MAAVLAVHIPGAAMRGKHPAAKQATHAANRKAKMTGLRRKQKRILQ